MITTSEISETLFLPGKKKMWNTNQTPTIIWQPTWGIQFQLTIERISFDGKDRYRSRRRRSSSSSSSSRSCFHTTGILPEHWTSRADLPLPPTVTVTCSWLTQVSIQITERRIPSRLVLIINWGNIHPSELNAPSTKFLFRIFISSIRLPSFMKHSHLWSDFNRAAPVVAVHIDRFIDSAWCARIRTVFPTWKNRPNRYSHPQGSSMIHRECWRVNSTWNSSLNCSLVARKLLRNVVALQPLLYWPETIFKKTMETTTRPHYNCNGDALEPHCNYTPTERDNRPETALQFRCDCRWIAQ